MVAGWAFIALRHLIISPAGTDLSRPGRPREYAQLMESWATRTALSGWTLDHLHPTRIRTEVYLMSSTGGNQQNLSQSPFVMQPDWSRNPAAGAGGGGSSSPVVPIVTEIPVVDVGTGTQDIYLYRSGRSIERLPAGPSRS
jgi:hypothetical protein